MGQLKYIASLVYGQLAGAGYAGLYPSWIEVNTNTDGAAANLGQLKEVFNFDLSTAPVAVTGLVATMGNPGEIDLSWTLPAVDNANSLTLLVSTDDGVTWTTLATLSPTATGYAATGLDPSQTYTFAVALGNGSGSSVSGSTTPTQPPSPPPAAPTGLTGILDSSNDMDLTWTASAGASSYVIDRELLVTGTWDLGYATSTTASYTDTGYFSDGYVGYHYRVSAVNGGGVSAPSTEFPLSRYAVINLGLNMYPIKVTNSGFILMFDGVTYYRWLNGTASPLNSESTNDYWINDIGEDGTVVGTLSGSQEAVWPPGSSTPTLSAPLTSVPVYYYPITDSTNNYEPEYYGSIDIAVGIFGSTIISQRSLGFSGFAGDGYSVFEGGVIDGSIPTDLFVGDVEQGNVTLPAVTPPEPTDPPYTLAIYNPQDQLMAANNAGEMLLEETDANLLTNGFYNPPTQIVLDGTTLDFTATSISNPVFGTTYAIGTDTNDIEGIWWDGFDHVMTDGIPVSLSAQTGLTTGGSAAPALQMVGYNNEIDEIPLLWQMDPNTGLFGSAQTLDDLLPAHAPWLGAYGTANETSATNPKEINDVGIIIGQTVSSTDGQVYGAAFIPNYIERDGNMVTSTNNTVCVGQQINLTNYISTNVPPSAITSYQWNIPGATSGTNATAFYDYEPNATNSGYVPLTNSYLTNSSCNFYWCGDATNLPVSCTEVIYGQTNTVSATLNIVRPTVGVTAAQGTIITSTNYYYIDPTTGEPTNGFPYMSFGINVVELGTNGMTFLPQNFSEPPGFTSGSNEWIQVINSDYVVNTTTAGLQPHTNSGGLDTFYPYPDTNSDGSSYDSPASPLPVSCTSVYRNFNATMYRMWRPPAYSVSGDHTVWVPLRSYQWNWSGTATNGSPGAGWGLASSNYPNSTATNVDTTNEPTWANNNTNNWNPPF